MTTHPPLPLLRPDASLVILPVEPQPVIEWRDNVDYRMTGGEWREACRTPLHLAVSLDLFCPFAVGDRIGVAEEWARAGSMLVVRKLTEL